MRLSYLFLLRPLLASALAALFAASAESSPSPRPAAAAVLFSAPVRDTEICDREAVRASRLHGISSKTLQAIARVETGMTRDGVFAPWPWTINVRGKGLRFRSKAEAVRYASSLLERGIRSFDVGCFQLNYRWHGRKFDGIEDMFTPRANADAAARFLLSLFQEFGTWSEAIGAYHSRTRILSRAYSARVSRARKRIGAAQSAPLSDVMPEMQTEIGPFSRKTNLPIVNLQERTGPLF